MVNATGPVCQAQSTSHHVDVASTNWNFAPAFYLRCPYEAMTDEVKVIMARRISFECR